MSPEVRSGSTTLPDVRQADARRTLGQVFDPRANALNAWRLGLALAVIVWHSWVLTGHQAPRSLFISSRLRISSTGSLRSRDF